MRRRVLHALLTQGLVYRYSKLLPHKCAICGTAPASTLAIRHEGQEIKYHEHCVIAVIDWTRNETAAQIEKRIQVEHCPAIKLVLEKILVIAKQDVDMERNKSAGSSKLGRSQGVTADQGNSR